MADQLWSTELKENTMVSSMVFGFFVVFCSFALYILDLKLKKLATKKHQGDRRNRHMWILLSLAKGPKKEQPTKTKLLDNNCSPPVKHYESRLWPYLSSKGQVKSLDFYPHQAVTKHPSALISSPQSGVREGQVRSWDFYHHQILSSC